MSEKIKVEPGTDGQQPFWPGEAPAAHESGTTSTETDPPRDPEKVIIPVVR